MSIEETLVRLYKIFNVSMRFPSKLVNPMRIVLVILIFAEFVFMKMSFVRKVVTQILLVREGFAS